MNTDRTGCHTRKECHKTESPWNHTATDYKENILKTEEVLGRSAVTLEMEWIKASYPWCLWCWCISIKAILNRRLKDFIFLFKVPIDTWKNFFEIYKQFGNAPSKSFTSPPLDCWTLRNKVLWFFTNIQTTCTKTQHYIPDGQQCMMFMNILTFISDHSYCLCLFHVAEADAQHHIKQYTIRQLTNEGSDSSQFTVSWHIEESNWYSSRHLIETESCCTPTVSSQTR